MSNHGKLSPAYRKDEAMPVDPDLQAYLDKSYLAAQPFVRVRHSQKVIVLFAGGSSVGKSTLAQMIGEEFQALVIENDGIKRVLMDYEHALSADLNPLTWSYTLGLYERLDQLTPNGLIVRDGMIHWYFDRLLPIFDKLGYRTIVIHFDISRSKNTELIVRRGDTATTTAERLLSLLDDHEIHMQRFLENYQPDFTVSEKDLFDHSRLIEYLHTVIQDQ